MLSASVGLVFNPDTGAVTAGRSRAHAVCHQAYYEALLRAGVRIYF